MARCGVVREGHVCRVHGTHLDHMDGEYVWANEVVQAAYAKPKPTEVFKQHRATARPAEHVDPAKDPRNQNRPQTNVPAQALASWQEEKAAWLAETEATFVSFLRQRTEPFTTPEHLWPLVRKPREMRAMVIVVRKMLRLGLMHQDGTRALRDAYTTSDGHRFAMNKHVPVYVSDMAGSQT